MIGMRRSTALAMMSSAPALLGWISEARVGQRRGQQHGFVAGQLSRALMEIVPARGLRPENAGAELGDVEIDLHHPLLRPERGHDISERHFERLADDSCGRSTDRGSWPSASGWCWRRASPPRPPPSLTASRTAPQSTPQCDAKPAILARDHRQGKLWRDVFQRHPVAPQRVAFQLLHQHHRRDRRIDEAEDDDGEENDGRDAKQKTRDAPEPRMLMVSLAALSRALA